MGDIFRTINQHYIFVVKMAHSAMDMLEILQTSGDKTMYKSEVLA
jgi:hypothetical protein